MTGNIKENETSEAISYMSQEMAAFNSELSTVSALVGQSDYTLEKNEGNTNLPRIKESAARIRLRTSKGRGIF